MDDTLIQGQAELNSFLKGSVKLKIPDIADNRGELHKKNIIIDPALLHCANPYIINGNVFRSLFCLGSYAKNNILTVDGYGYPAYVLAAAS